ncbi:hypothetical protein J7337_000355 [Fusarium musae]|uniref:Uncharacterized protein n=1 Tax=Fusarium musae TaxID=1042133 RepID=A0A9P8IVE7_9HYPO|nr:hypothetical protein J7337_000355 [Fusarium musae]KAG9506813.1 hypothetical protein J7337_000355 [Fusarium musae]
MSERSGQQVADPSTAKSPQDGVSVPKDITTHTPPIDANMKKQAKVDSKKKRYPRPPPQNPTAKWLALMEKVSRESRDRGDESGRGVEEKH